MHEQLDRIEEKLDEVSLLLKLVLLRESFDGIYTDFNGLIGCVHCGKLHEGPCPEEDHVSFSRNSK